MKDNITLFVMVLLIALFPAFAAWDSMAQAHEVNSGSNLPQVLVKINT